MIDGKCLYEVKQIIEYLPEDEYALIPQDMIDFIEGNYEYDENIVIDPNKDLNKQRLRRGTYKVLEKILKIVGR